MKKLLIAFTMLCSTAFAAEAPKLGPESEPILYVLRATVARVVDGDTIELAGEELPYDLVRVGVRIRLLGVNAPETRTTNLVEKAAGLATKAFVESLLPVGTRVRVVIRENGQTDNFGRTLAWVILADGTNLSTLLLEKGLAVPYEGD